MVTAVRTSLGTYTYFFSMLALGLYFMFAAVQGDYGVFQRSVIMAEERGLQDELAILTSEVAEMENLTIRLSDTYLDLDLLDQQARDVLGMIRADEIVIR